MKVLLILTLVIFTAYAGRRLGCWRDHSHRAIAGGIRFRGSPARCEAFARKHGWRVYAVQYGGECFTGPNAHRTYSKYGHAHNCRHGRGGGWANDVYEVWHWQYYRRLILLRKYRWHAMKWRRLAIAQRRRLNVYNSRYASSARIAVRYYNLNSRWVSIGNAHARVANSLRRSHTYYVKRYKAQRRACNRSLKHIAAVANNIARKQRYYYRRYKYDKAKARLYRNRYFAAKKKMRIQAALRKRVYAKYNRYVHMSNAWVRKYNWAAHHHG